MGVGGTSGNKRLDYAVVAAVLHHIDYRQSATTVLAEVQDWSLEMKSVVTLKDKDGNVKQIKGSTTVGELLKQGVISVRIVAKEYKPTRVGEFVTVDDIPSK